MTQQLSLAVSEYPIRFHVLSDCELYRYLLEYRWAPGPVVVWVMCNPSRATADEDDHTTRKCTGFAKHWGCGGWRIVNVCAYRSRNPKALRAHSPVAGVDMVGPQNLMHVEQAVGRTDVDRIVLGWGDALPKRFHPLALDLARRIGSASMMNPLCLGVTGAGQPKHPLTLAYETTLESWSAP